MQTETLPRNEAKLHCSSKTWNSIVFLCRNWFAESLLAKTQHSSCIKNKNVTLIVLLASKKTPEKH